MDALCQSRTYLRTYTRLIAMLGPEIWNISEGRMTHKGKAAVVEEGLRGFQITQGQRLEYPSTLKSANPHSIRSRDTCSQWRRG